ncbi:MAG TPA: DUF6266 family protein [Lentimicrobium sp.]|nr:DUF6266 family protein [Lentimicrobium sp.]
MARINPDGTYSGKVGNVVYFRRNGKTFMKEYKKPTDPKKPSQMSQRAKLTVASGFLSGFRKIIDTGYQGTETHSTGYQEALEYHMEHALREITAAGSEKPDFEVSIDKVKLSRGLIDTPQVDSCERAGNKILLNWVPTLGGIHNRLYDSLALVAYNQQTGVTVNYHVGCRDDGSGSTLLPDEFTEPVHLWVFYLNQEKNRQKHKQNVSGSIYLGEF